jgi:Icc-related predicted phosphoesterase
LKIAFVGDVHGRVFHCLAGISMLQERLRERFTAVIQVGDFGYPDPDGADAPTRHYLALDPAEAGVRDLLGAQGETARGLTRLREALSGPVLFIRGNHEDFAWLKALEAQSATPSAAADPFDLFHFVPDGTVLTIDGVRLAFLGGVEEQQGDPGIDLKAWEALCRLGTGRIDVLVTHQGAYGSSTGYYGDTHGSHLVSKLVKKLQPNFHVFGHAHQLLGPKVDGATTWLGLDGLVASPRWEPDARGLCPGCFGVLDTETGSLEPVTDTWLTEFPTPFDFGPWLSGGRGA